MRCLDKKKMDFKTYCLNSQPFNRADYCDLKSMLCLNHTGKMFLINSLSTTPFNLFCELRAKNKATVCYYCYSRQQQGYRKTLKNKLKRNTENITKRLLTVSEIVDSGIDKMKVFRFESFGEITNFLQVINYFNICYVCKNTTFTIFTKNPFIIDYVINKLGYKKPKNLIIIYSMLYVNDKQAFERAYKIFKIYPFIDKFFMVCTEEFIEKYSLKKTCCQNCINCLKCYDLNDTTIFIIETLKGKRKK